MQAMAHFDARKIVQGVATHEIMWILVGFDASVFGPLNPLQLEALSQLKQCKVSWLLLPPPSLLAWSASSLQPSLPEVQRWAQPGTMMLQTAVRCAALNHHVRQPQPCPSSPLYLLTTDPRHSWTAQVQVSLWKLRP